MKDLFQFQRRVLLTSWAHQYHQQGLTNRHKGPFISTQHFQCSTLSLSFFAFVFNRTMSPYGVSNSIDSNGTNACLFHQQRRQQQRRHVRISPFVDQGLHIPRHTKNKIKNNALEKKKKKSKPAYRLVDQQRLRAEGGSGGKGSTSMARNTTRRLRSRPDGGHGGNGGCVYLMADPQTHALAYRTPHVTAESGHHGSSQQRHGRHGRNTVVRVPCGVVVRRVLDDDEEWDAEQGVVVKIIPPTQPKATTAHADDEDGDHVPVIAKENAEKNESKKLVASKNTVKNDKSKKGKLKLDEKPFHKDNQGVQYFRIKEGDDNYFFDDDEEEEEYDDEEEVTDDSDDDDDEEQEQGSYRFRDFDAEDDLADALRRKRRLQPRRKVVLADLDQPGAHVLVARGGRGGLGSTLMLSTSNRRRPDSMAMSRIAEPRPGEVAYLELELKLIADVGLVGFPNAGKSSLLAALSRAAPEIAPYPFTTLHPLIGCIEYRDGLQIRAADVPGLIGGASEGRGCGHEFLRHLERTKALLYVIDGAGVDGRHPLQDLQVLASELSNYKDGDMLTRPAMVVANKMDLLTSQQSETLLQELAICAKELGIQLAGDVIGISAGVSGVGLAPLTRSIRKVVTSHELLSTSTSPSMNEQHTG